MKKVSPSHEASIPKKPFYKRWWFIAIVIALIVGIIASVNSDEDYAPNISGADTQQATGQVVEATGAIVATEPDTVAVEWVRVAELSGAEDMLSGAPFLLQGGEVRVVAQITADGGAGSNGLVYILEEGSTTVLDADGFLRIAGIDLTIMAITGRYAENESIIEREAGSYYIHFNSTGLYEWSVFVYEPME